MKRLIIFVTAMLLTAINVSAQQISLNVAAQKASAFVNKGDKQLKITPTLVYKAEKPSTALSNPDDAYFYVFNKGFNQGFVIVSGDERTNEILGYCDNGTFDPNNIPPNFKYFLEEYENQIKYLQENNIQQAPRKAPTKANIPYLIQTQWNQDDPYNYYLQGNVTGCVATAMAQVMYYWQWPQEATATIPAYAGSGNLTVSTLEPTVFNWSKMKKKYYSGDYSDGHEVAKLMKYVGHAVMMNYDTSANGGSAAYASDIISALNKYFGYPNDEQFLKRTDFLSATKWADTIYANLAKAMPVIMAGGRHCYICDGYNSSDDKYHINWGWGGYYDGNYDLEVLDPEGSGIGGSSGGYASNCQIVTRIHNPNTIIPEIPKDSIPLTASSIRMYAGAQTLTRNARANSVSGDLRYYIPVNTEITDNEQTDTLLVGLGYYNEDDNLIGVYGASYKLFNIDGGYYSNSISSFGAEYPYGTYRLYPVWGDFDAGQWKKINNADKTYIQAEVLEDGKTIKITPSKNLSVNVNETGSGNNWKQTLTVTNNGTEPYIGTLIIYCYNYSNNSVTIENLAVGASETIDITSKVYGSGRYSIDNFAFFVLGSESIDDGLWDNYPYLIGGLSDFWTEAPWTGTLHLGNNLKFSVELENVGYNRSTQNVKVTLFPKGGEVSNGTSVTKSITIDGYSATSADFDFSNLTYNEEYAIELFGGEIDDTLFCYTLSDYGYYVKPVKGAVVWGNENSFLMLDDSVANWTTIPEDAYFVDATYSEKATSLVPSNNPNTLYLLTEGSAIPTKLEGKNVIIGTTCEELNLEEGYDFYTTVDFTAKKANYKRTFVKGNDGTIGNWETLVLPFDVNKVTKDDGATTLSWFTDKSQHGKNFWIYRFASEDADNTVVFNCPESANLLPGGTPYIITVPSQSSKWADKWVLTGKELTFSGENVILTTASSRSVTTLGANKKFDFVGRTYASERNQVYVLNEAGNHFNNTQTNLAELNPFRCYFVGYFNNDALTIKMRLGDNESTDIEGTLADNDAPTAAAPAVYTLDGKAIGSDVKQLPVGTYVTKGKKFMVKNFNPTFPKLK